MKTHLLDFDRFCEIVRWIRCSLRTVVVYNLLCISVHLCACAYFVALSIKHSCQALKYRKLNKTDESKLKDVFNLNELDSWSAWYIFCSHLSHSIHLYMYLFSAEILASRIIIIEHNELRRIHTMKCTNLFIFFCLVRFCRSVALYQIDWLKNNLAYSNWMMSIVE